MNRKVPAQENDSGDEEVALDDGETPEAKEEEPDEGHKRMLQLAHEQMGHPSRRSFARTLHLGGARPGVVTWVRRHFRCDQCEQHGRPAPIRRSSYPEDI